MNKITRSALSLAIAVSLIISGCAQQSATPVYDKFTVQFFGAFDTIFQLVGYAPSRQEFDAHSAFAQERFTQLSQTFDRFARYDGVNNMRSVNDNAGRAPVKVDPVVIDLIELCRDWHDRTNGQLNIAMGSVTDVWHEYMETYSGSDDGKLPAESELTAAAVHMSMDDVIVNREQSTVYLAKEGMLLDLGAAAKGYAAELVANELVERGFQSFLISAGGNVVSRGAPMDGVRSSWGVGIQDPFVNPNDPSALSTDVVFVDGESVVTSGDYQRYYMVDGQLMHHIIDPDTLMPANYYRGLSVVHENSGIADILSTALFCMDYESGRRFADDNDLKIIWIFDDGNVEYTDALKSQLRDRGGATAAITK